jgi:cytochrome P450
MTATQQASIQAAARARAYAMPLAAIDVSDSELYAQGTLWPYFERLRHEDPVHYCADSPNGPFWSVTKFNDIMHVDTNHKTYSSEAHLGGITLFNIPQQMRRPSFISMDPPKHDDQRRAVSPIVAPANLVNLSGLIRTRACAILDSLPRNETFDWVDKVSIELTTQMLATLFDFPSEDRRLLTYWSDVVTAIPAPGAAIDSWDKREAELGKCLAYFTRLWNERINAPPRADLVSMLAHSPATRNMGGPEFLGTLGLLIVGGNDTTRNSISGGLWHLSQNPDEFAKLRANPSLIPNMVSEIIRYQTPLAHMRRTALADTELNGKQIKKGDKVVMWYISGNRDDEVIEEPNLFVIDRPRARQHLSFGFGVHRCVGNRLAEMQLTILWEEILKRFPVIEVVGEPERLASCFVHGYKSMQVRIPA